MRFAGLAYALLVLILGTNLPTPLYAVYQQEFGFSPLLVTLVFASYMAALIPSLLLCGPLADTVGYRPVVVAAIGLAATGSLLFAFAADLVWLLAARAVQGLAVGAASGPLTAALVQTEPTGRPYRGSLTASTVLLAGAGLGPVLGGALAQYAPAPRTLCYLVEVALLSPAMVAAAALPRRAGPGARWRPRRPQVPRAVVSEFALAGSVSVLGWAVAYVVLALVPSYLTTLLDSRNLLLGGGAAGLLLVCAAGAQFLLARWSSRKAQAIGLALLIVGLVGVIGVGVRASLLLLLSTMAVAGAGIGIAFMGALRQVNEVAPDAEHAGVASAFYVVTYLGAAIPVIGVGLLATSIGLVPAVQIFATVIAISCSLALAVLRRTSQTSSTGGEHVRRHGCLPCG